MRGRQCPVAVMRRDPVLLHRAIQHHGLRELEARAVEELHDRVVAPGCGRADFGDAQALRLALEPGQQRGADSLALLARRHAHRLQQQCRFRPTELAQLFACLDEADEPAVLLRRELDVPLGLVEGRLQAPLEVQLPGMTHDGRIQCDHRFHVLGFGAAKRDPDRLRLWTGCQGVLLLGHNVPWKILAWADRWLTGNSLILRKDVASPGSPASSRRCHESDQAGNDPMPDRGGQMGPTDMEDAGTSWTP